MEKRQDFDHVRGDANIIIVAITDTDGSPFDLSGGLIRWRAVSHGQPGDPPTVKIEKTTAQLPTPGIAIIELNGPPGILDGMVVTLAPGDTVDLAIGNYNHEAEITLNSNPRTLFQGNMRLLRDIIR